MKMEKASNSPVPNPAGSRMTPPLQTALCGPNPTDFHRIMQNFETPNFSPSSTVSSVSQTPGGYSQLSGVTGIQENSKNCIDPRLQNFLASISSDFQHQNVPQMAPTTSVLDVLLKQQQLQAPENQMNLLLNRILYSNQLESQPKSEALNRLDHVLDVYIERETNFIQVRQAKLADLANLRTLIKDSREKNIEFEMSLNEITKLADIITHRLSTPQQEDPLAMTPQQSPQIMQQQPIMAPAAMTYQQQQQPNINDLLIPLLAGFSSTQSPMSFTNGNEMKPRFVKKEEFSYRVPQEIASRSTDSRENLKYVAKHENRGSCERSFKHENSCEMSSKLHETAKQELQERLLKREIHGRLIKQEIHERSSKREIHERSPVRDGHARLSNRDSISRSSRRSLNHDSRERSSHRDSHSRPLHRCSHERYSNRSRSRSSSYSSRDHHRRHR